MLTELRRRRKILDLSRIQHSVIHQNRWLDYTDILRDVGVQDLSILHVRVSVLGGSQSGPAPSTLSTDEPGPSTSIPQSTSSQDGVTPPPKKGHGGSRKGSGHPRVASEYHPSAAAHKKKVSQQDFEQLNTHLQYIQENDEHADITAGDRVIDESLGDSVSDNAESDAVAAEAETQSSQPAKKSAVHDYLKQVHDQLQREEAKHGKPSCYNRSDFFYRPSHAVFSLQKIKDTTGLDPTAIQINSNASVDSDYRETGFQMTLLLAEFAPCRLIISFNSAGCGTTFRGTDPHIIAQLPRHVQAAFPVKAYISARGAISTLMMRQMSNTFSSRFGPAPFSELVSEIQHREHADRELMYLAAANFYGQPVTTPFSAFDDPNGYAGSVPSVKYLKAMFTDFISAVRIFIERDIATLPLDAAKADHTFDVLKHTGRVKGERIFAALYTILNQFEEIRGHSLTFSKSLQFLKEMYDGILQGLIDSGNLPTQVLYTDSPQAERNFHESINSSLSQDVEPVTDWTDCPPFLRTSNFPTINVSDPMVIEDLASEILAEVTAVTSPSQLSFVALAMKTDLQSDDRLHARTIQLRTKDKIYIFDVVQFPRFNGIAAFTSPTNLLPSLRAIFTNPSIIKVGLSIRETLQTISEILSVPELQDVLAAKNPPLLDLGKYAKLKGATDEPLSSLHALAGIILNRAFSMPEFPSSVAASAAQNQQKQAETDGQLVTLVQGYKPVAEGCIIGRHIGYLDAVMDDAGHTKRINVSASRSLIQISKWIFAHGKQAVVTTSQLHTRGMTPPTPANPLSRGFVAPTQLPVFDVEDEFHITYSVTHLSDSEEDSDNDSDPEEDEYGQLAFQVQLDPDLNEDSPDPRQGIEGEFQAVHNDTPMNPMVEGLQHAHTLLSAAVESEKLPSRVLDDAFRFMDRLLRLLSKKHSAFKAFSHDFSEAIFIRDKSDVGFHNRTGQKYKGHYDLWVRDEIVELAEAVGLKPSFPMPRVLLTRIATSETIGILPISTSLAADLNITTLPRPRIADIESPLNQPTNIYRYLQLRQRVLYAVLPVHTHMEYSTFKIHISDSQFRKGGKTYPPHEQGKNIDFQKFAKFWNILVHGQSRTVTDSNQRLYYKLPLQLETHHKKTIPWKSEISTLGAGANFAARAPLLAMLNSPANLVDSLPALPLPDGELDLSVSGSDVVDPRSFNSMAVPLSGEHRDSDFDDQILAPTFHNLFQNQQNSQMDEEDTAMDIDPPQFVAPILHQMLLPATASNGMSVPGMGTENIVVATTPLHRQRRNPGSWPKSDPRNLLANEIEMFLWNQIVENMLIKVCNGGARLLRYNFAVEIRGAD
ncbi:hypothetical protein B0H13DRAFT_2270697 [Mycena leptocephala]|nr:hypothetical protein B0H13DRAFT_2270697 [Mycena leptocephala]